MSALVDRLRAAGTRSDMDDTTRDLLREARLCIEQHQSNDAQRSRAWSPPYGVAFTELAARVGALERVLTMAIANAGPAKGSPADKAGIADTSGWKNQWTASCGPASAGQAQPASRLYTLAECDAMQERLRAAESKLKRKAPAKPVKRAASKPSRKAARI